MENLNSVIIRLRHFLKDNKRKGILQIIWDVIVLTIQKKGLPFFYFGRMIYRTEAGNCQNYFSTREYYSIINSHNFNTREYNSIMHNKLMLALFCQQNCIPAPKLLGYNFRDYFYFKGQYVRITDRQNLASYFESLFDESGAERIFVKPHMSKGGAGAFLLYSSTMAQQLVEIWEVLRDHFYIFQETVTQHPEINRIYPHSVNTLRINTYFDEKGALHVLPTVMRFGMGGSVVDNNSRGGVYIITDGKNGMLGESAKTALISGSYDYTVHPDTGVRFSDCTIPYYHEAHKFCINLTTLLPNKLTGWDVAISPDGPLLIEANANPDFLMGELEHGGYLQYPVFRKMLASI